MNVFKKINLNILQFDRILNVNGNFDIIKRTLKIGNNNACIYYIDGFIKDNALQEIIRFMLLTEENKMSEVKNISDYLDNLLPYMEVSVEQEFEEASKELLSGCVVLFIDGLNEAIIVDARTYPQRQIQEPEQDKVLRGARDGFIETPIFNMVLIRRRIRNENLTFECQKIGEKTQNDVVIGYMSDKVDKKRLELVKKKLDEMKPNDLTMGIASLIEAMFPKKYLNPFPKTKLTSRPDVVSASLLEGRIVLFVDNTPCAAILPTYFWDFFQEAGDYYFTPPIALYLKITRYIIGFLTVFLTPLWLLAIKNMEVLPEWLKFLNVQEWNSIPLILQLLAMEFVIDVLRQASINTPSMISTSISLIGAVIIR